jgi:hypothetical protein
MSSPPITSVLREDRAVTRAGVKAKAQVIPSEACGPADRSGGNVITSPRSVIQTRHNLCRGEISLLHPQTSTHDSRCCRMPVFTLTLYAWV